MKDSPVTMKPNLDDTEPNDAPAAPQARRAGLRVLDIERAKPAAKPYRMPDGRGLYLWVKPTGAKVWRTNYVINGTKHLLTLGEYPAMTLAGARDARSKVRLEVRAGANPTRERAQAREASRRAERANLRGDVRAPWAIVPVLKTRLKSACYAAETKRRVERDVPIAVHRSRANPFT